MAAALKIFQGDSPSPPNANLPFDPIQDPNLSDRACRVLWALTYWAWGKKPDCWPSNGQIARLIHRDTRTVQRGLAELIEAGYVERRMVPDAAGWHRILVLTFRAPQLRIHPADEPPGGDSPVTTPPTNLSPPPMTDLSSQSLKESTKKTSSPPPARPPVQGPPPPAREPSLETDLLTPEQLAHWRGLLAHHDRVWRRLAQAVLNRHETAARAPGAQRTGPGEIFLAETPGAGDRGSIPGHPHCSSGDRDGQARNQHPA